MTNNVYKAEREWPMTNLKYNFQEFCNRSGCDSAEVERIYKAFSSVECWLGGGAIRRTLIKQALDSDFDFFFKSVDYKNTFVATAKSKGMSVVRETKHHTELRGTLEGSDLPVVVQAIHFKYYENIEQVLDSFDYTITQFVYDGEFMHTTDEALWDLGRKKLAIHKITYPVATMRRMLKYSNQGFTACGGCMADLYRKTLESTEALGELDIEYVD